MAAADIAAQIAAYDQNKVTSESALNDALKQYGIPEIRQNVAGLRTTVANTTNALKSVDPSVTGRTQGSLVTEAQRQRQVNTERAPIADQLGTFSGQLNDSERNLNEATGQANQLASNKVNDYNMGRQALQSQYDTAYKAEQDAAAREAQRQAFEYQKQQDAIGNQLASAKAYSSGAGKAASPAATKAAVTQHVASGLASMVGKDGKVGNNTWAAALNDAVGAGYTVREFWQKFGQYVNPKYKSSYAGYAQR